MKKKGEATSVEADEHVGHVQRTHATGRVGSKVDEDDAKSDDRREGDKDVAMEHRMFRKVGVLRLKGFLREELRMLGPSSLVLQCTCGKEGFLVRLKSSHDARHEIGALLRPHSGNRNMHRLGEFRDAHSRRKPKKPLAVSSPSFPGRLGRGTTA